jgi:hypothetical protein
MSKPVRRRVRGQKEEETVEKSIVIVNYMENGYCRSVHGDILLPSEDTEMGAKIILLGYGDLVIDAYILYVESCNKNNCIPMSHNKFK